MVKVPTVPVVLLMDKAVEVVPVVHLQALRQAVTGHTITVAVVLVLVRVLI